MRTPAQVAGHPIHPMLVALPIGMWVFSLVADFIGLRSGAAATWHAAALYTMVGGIIGALLAAVFGFIDVMSLREDHVKRVGFTHMTLNLVITVLYIVNAWTRVHSSVSPNVSLSLSIIAIALLLVSGWLGGHMVYKHGVAVSAADTAPSTEHPFADRSRSWSRAASAAPRTGVYGDRAMAADSERPSREREE